MIIINIIRYCTHRWRYLKIKILMIGNGFDIGNHLNTKPNDFMQYVKKNDPCLYQIANCILYKSLIPQNKSVFWNNIEGNLELSSIPPTDPNIYSKQPTLPQEYIDYFVKGLNSNLKEWIGTVESDITQPCIRREEDYCEWISETDVFINFNYTSTLEKLYDVEESKVFHIHGSFNDSPQIGHKKVKETAIDPILDSSILCPEGTNEQRINSLLRATEKNTKGNYVSLKEFLTKDNDDVLITDVYSIGLSFSKVDCDYLRYMKNDNLITEETNWHIGIYADTEKDAIAEKDAIKKNIDDALQSFKINSNRFKINNFS